MNSLLFVLLAAGFADQPGEPAVKEPGLRRELLDMRKTDQDARFAWLALMKKKDTAGAGAEDPQLARDLAAAAQRVKEVDDRNRARIKEIVDRHGWPGKTLVGKDGADTAWLLVQHADSDRPFQKRCLESIKAMPKGEVEPKHVAYLTDRVLAGEGKKQLYGTQLQTVEGKLVPQPIEDEANVDKRRAEMGMESLADYLGFAREALQGKKEPGEKKPPTDASDCGASAAREYLRLELSDLAGRFLGPGDWAPSL